jgi:hypothetical protein
MGHFASQVLFYILEILTTGQFVGQLSDIYFEFLGPVRDPERAILSIVDYFL